MAKHIGLLGKSDTPGAKIGLRVRADGHGGQKSTGDSDATPGEKAGPAAPCSLCGRRGHGPADHGSLSGTSDLSEDHGEAARQDEETQFPLTHPSSQTTGSSKYKSPGSAGGMT